METNTSTKTKKLELILIDDSAEDTELAVRMFKKSGLTNQIHTFTKAKQALDFLLNRIKDEGEISAYTYILLDLNMPEMDGLEFLQTIRANEKTKNIPVAVLTSTTKLDDIQKSMRMDVEYITKPIESADILQIANKFGFSLSLVKDF